MMRAISNVHAGHKYPTLATVRFDLLHRRKFMYSHTCVFPNVECKFNAKSFGMENLFFGD